MTSISINRVFVKNLIILVTSKSGDKTIKFSVFLRASLLLLEKLRC